MDDVLLKQRLACRSEGDKVVLCIGNYEHKMDYTTALKLSQWMRVASKEAKQVAGDGNSHWTVMGLLDSER